MDTMMTPGTLDQCLATPPMKELFAVLKTTNNKNGTSVLVHGPPGAGKTLGVRLMLENLGFPDHEIVHVDAAVLKINPENTTKVKLQLQKTLTSVGFNLGGRKSRMALIIDSVLGSYPKQGEDIRRDTALLKVLAELLHDHSDHAAVLVIIADERATPAIRDLEVTAVVPFYKPTQGQLTQLATATNMRHGLGFSSAQIRNAVGHSTDFRQLRLNMHLLKINPAGSLASSDGTGEPNLFKRTRALFTRKMPSALRGQYEDLVDSTGLNVFAGMIHQNCPMAVESMSQEFFGQDKKAAELRQMGLLRQMADDVSYADMLASNLTDFQSWHTDRVGPELTSTHLVMAAQQTHA